MKVAIKNPTPRGKNREHWGDLHFGRAIEGALARHGVKVAQHLWPDWEFDGEDVALWLRGKRRCHPLPSVVNALWIVSHPSSVTDDELREFDIVFAGSEMLAGALEERGIREVEVMRQCTDPSVFYTIPDIVDVDRHGLLYVANSRGMNRPVLQWALGAGLTPTLIGRGWDQVGQEHLVKADYVPNRDLPTLYNRARYGMNDHWGDMAYYQIINNRIFDSLACGLPVISDGFPELSEVAGDAVWTARDAKSFRDAYWEIRLDYAGARQRCRDWWERHGTDFSFDSRARQILNRLASASPRGSTPAQPSMDSDLADLAIEMLRECREPERSSTRISHSLLHIAPSLGTSGPLAGLPWLSRISAGFGQGPWETHLDDGLQALGGRQYDVILVEGSACAGKTSIPESARPALADHLRLGGFLVFSELSMRDAMAADPRLGKDPAREHVLKRTVANTESARYPSHHQATLGR